METLQNLIDQTNMGNPIAIALYAVVMVTGITGIVWAGAAHVASAGRTDIQGKR
jgi:hypothetical protein